MEQKDIEAFSAIFGDCFSEVKVVRDIPLQLRTLYDHEMLDVLRKSAESTEFIVKDFLSKRWSLAYAIQNINDTDFTKIPVDDKYQMLIDMPTIVFEQLYNAYVEVCTKEAELAGLLGESGEILITPNVSL